MNIHDAILNGQVFKNGPKESANKGKKKKLSGAQQMRADYKKRIQAKAAARAKKRLEREADKGNNTIGLE